MVLIAPFVGGKFVLTRDNAKLHITKIVTEYLVGCNIGNKWFALLFPILQSSERDLLSQCEDDIGLVHSYRSTISFVD